MNPLPPQAYTKETLGKAFAWLQTQSENIKEMATSSDVLVSLYLKAKLNGNGALERPSIQNFKSELKSLAGMMGEFEVVDPSMNAEARLQNEMQMPIANSLHSSLNNSFATAQAAPSAQNRSALPTPAQPAPVTSQPSVQPAGSTGLSLDSQSLAMIHEVKTLLNLSSDTEALRALIAVGAKTLKKI